MRQCQASSQEGVWTTLPHIRSAWPQARPRYLHTARHGTPRPRAVSEPQALAHGPSMMQCTSHCLATAHCKHTAHRTGQMQRNKNPLPLDNPPPKKKKKNVWHDYVPPRAAAAATGWQLFNCCSNARACLPFSTSASAAAAFVCATS